MEQSYNSKLGIQSLRLANSSIILLLQTKIRAEVKKAQQLQFIST